eukprot:2530786-Ditylum_brightwellii.AAC.1
MCLLHEGSKETCLCEEFNRSKAMPVFGKAIMKVDGLVEGKQPKVNTNLIRLMEHCVNEHCTAPKCDSLDGTFSNAILVVCPNAAEGEAL